MIAKTSYNHHKAKLIADLWHECGSVNSQLFQVFFLGHFHLSFVKLEANKFKTIVTRSLKIRIERIKTISKDKYFFLI